MNWRTYLILAILGLSLSLAIAAFQAFPGYMDSDYYFAGGVQLAQGKGFTEPYIWNYLDDPQGLPHPSNTYWMPLSSIIAAVGMVLTSHTTYQAGRLGFILLAGLVPVTAAALAYDFSKRRDLALTTGLLAVFSGFYAPYLPVTDNYGPYLILGGLYFLFLKSDKYHTYFLLGVISGLLALARSDGLMWFGLTILVILCRYLSDKRLVKSLILILSSLSGFGLIMFPWFWRTYSIYGSLLAPGGSHLLWLKTYEETFIYPADQLNIRTWLSTGWGNIFSARLTALKWNLLNAFFPQGGIFFTPFILIGLWKLRQDIRVRLAIFAWFWLLFVMTVIFPYAGWRGGFFHSASSLQIIWWSCAPIGLQVVVTLARKRNLFTPDAIKVFQAALVGIAIFITVFVVFFRALPGWGMDGERGYPKIEAYLHLSGIQPNDIVMVRNPPGYYMMTGQPSIVIPYGDETVMSLVAIRYHAKFVILEEAGAAGPIKTLYDDKQNQHFIYMSEIDGTRIFEFKP